MVDEITTHTANLDSADLPVNEVPTRGHIPVVIVGGGQAGLSTSWFLKQRGIAHVLLEKNNIGYSWREERWDTFCLVTPNWQCTLPDYPYQGDDPDGFMVKDQIVEYLEGFAKKVDAPILEGVTVTNITRAPNGTFTVKSTAGDWTTDHVVMAISGYHLPSIPRVGERLPLDLYQIHSQAYRNPQQLPEGEVLIVGTGLPACRGPTSCRAQGTYRRRQRAALAAPISRQGYDPLALRHGLLRHDGGHASAWCRGS